MSVMTSRQFEANMSEISLFEFLTLFLSTIFSESRNQFLFPHVSRASKNILFPLKLAKSLNFSAYISCFDFSGVLVKFFISKDQGKANKQKTG